MKIHIIYIDPGDYDKFYLEYAPLLAQENMKRHDPIDADKMRWNKLKDTARLLLTDYQYTIFCGFASGWSGSEIAEKFGISRQMVSKIKIKIILRMKEHFSAT